MRTNDKFLPTFIAAALSFVFLSVFPALSSREGDEDAVRKFDITVKSLGRTGLAYKPLGVLLDDQDVCGAFITTAGRASLKITDKDKFKKTFRDLHLSILHSLGNDNAGLQRCAQLERFDEYEDRAMCKIRIKGAYLFNITSQRAIVKSFEELLEMLNTTVDALRLYALQKLNPTIIKLVQDFIKIDDESESQSEGDEHDYEDQGDEGQGNGTPIGPNPPRDERAEEASLKEAIRKLRAMVEKQKVEIEETKAELAVRVSTEEQQKETLGLYQPFQMILNAVFSEKNIDQERFAAAMDDKNSVSIKDLLSPHYDESLVETIISDLKEEWEAESSESEEQGDEQGEEGSGTPERHQDPHDEHVEEGDLNEKIRELLHLDTIQKAEIEETKAELAVRVSTVKQQKDTLGLYQPFQMILNVVLAEKNIDQDQFAGAMDDKNSDRIKDLLSPHYDESLVETLITDLTEEWEAESSESEEQGDEQGDQGDQGEEGVV
ncbi:MAG: hypothetical protein K2X53_00120 [Alphaproteobacteria bacterium]|nr:hypothetical protein [Alphaproteobacteria bacterium]